MSVSRGRLKTSDSPRHGPALDALPRQFFNEARIAQVLEVPVVIGDCLPERHVVVVVAPWREQATPPVPLQDGSVPPNPDLAFRARPTRVR